MVNTSNVQNKKIVFKFGIGFLFMAGILWASPLYIPFTALDTSQKIVTITVCIVAAEILFWVGAVSVGKEYIQKFKGRFSPKYRKNPSINNVDEYNIEH